MGPLFLSIDGLFPVKNCGGHFMRHVKYKLPVWDNVCFTPQGVRVTISWPDFDGIVCPAFKGAVIAGM